MTVKTRGRFSGILKKTREASPVLPIVVFVCVLIPLIYILYTNQIWEDFLITFRFSENLVNGHGLVYYPGERIYGFTSPLETLLLAFCYLLTGKFSYLAAIWAYRIICMMVFAGAGVLLYLTMSGKNKKNGLKAGALILLYLAEVKTVAFSVNGMETAFVLLFLSAFIYLFSADFFKNYFYLALCWAGLIWTRPDGCVYIFALAPAIFIFGGYPKKKTFIVLLKMLVISSALYLPWFIWSWYYYGSPIPHTVIAKAHDALAAIKYQTLETRYSYLFENIFGPFYYLSDTGSWPNWIRIFTRSIGFFVFIYWLFPVKNKMARMLSFVFFILSLYYLFIKPFPWYFPPAALLGFIVITSALYDFARAKKYRIVLSAGIFIIIVSGFISIFIMTAQQMRVQQKEVETGLRQQVGLWLKENVLAKETVYCEPLGYIGYFSEAKMLDYPGLVSDEVVCLLKNSPDADFYTIFDALAPDWVVLRAYQAQKLSSASIFFTTRYEQVKDFDISQKLTEKYKDIPGIELLLTDARFIIFKKNRGRPVYK